MRTKFCKKCGIEFTPQKGLINYCSLKCRNSRVFSDEAKLKKSIANKGNPKCAWNKGKTGIAHSSWKGGKSKFICQYCGEQGESYNLNKKYHNACWKKCAGGYRKGSGRGKKGWYKGYFCDSSYELAWVIYNLEHNIKFERNTEKFNYIFENKNYKYIPDFILDDNTYIEIKGYYTKQTEEKIKQFPYQITILYRNNLQIEFDYVEQKYGKHFIELYEGNPYKMKNNSCKYCGEPAKYDYCSRRCSGKAVNKFKYNSLITNEL